MAEKYMFFSVAVKKSLQSMYKLQFHLSIENINLLEADF